MVISPEEFSKHPNLKAPAFRMAVETHLKDNAGEINAAQLCFAQEGGNRILPVGMTVALEGDNIQIAFVPFFKRILMHEVAAAMKTVADHQNTVAFLASFDAIVHLADIKEGGRIEQSQSDSIVTIWSTVWWPSPMLKLTSYKKEANSFQAQEVTLEKGMEVFTPFDTVLPKLNLPPITVH